MRRELLTGVSTIALVIASASAATLFSDPAGAADLARKAAPAPMAAPAPAYSWTGCYVGAHVGWGWGHANATETSFAPASFTTRAGSSGVNTNGGLFGGQVGCNYQFAGAWVVGIQGDFAGTDINGRANDHFNTAFSDFVSSDQTIAVKTEWLASVTGRIGWAAFNNQALFYFKGGGAWARNQWDLHDAALGFNNPVFSENRSGWTVGVGAEWTLWSPNWTAFVEYNFYDFNSGGTTVTQNVCGVGCPFSNGFTSGKMEINTVKVGVNYKLGWFGGGGY